MAADKDPLKKNLMSKVEPQGGYGSPRYL